MNWMSPPALKITNNTINIKICQPTRNQFISRTGPSLLMFVPTSRQTTWKFFTRAVLHTYSLQLSQFWLPEFIHTRLLETFLASCVAKRLPSTTCCAATLRLRFHQHPRIERENATCRLHCHATSSRSTTGSVRHVRVNPRNLLGIDVFCSS